MRRALRLGMTALAVLGACSAAPVAEAAPTGLFTIPTADLVPVRQWTFQLQNGNTQLDDPGSVWSEPEPAPQSQFGLPGARAEAGVDLVAVDAPSDYRAVANVKVLLLGEGEDWPAVAAGVQQLGHGLDAAWYAVASRTLNYRSLQYQKFRAHHRNIRLHGVRLHAGVTGAAGTTRALAGSDVELSEHWIAQADWTSGPARSATLGATWVLDARTSVQAAMLRGNDSHRVDGLQAGFTRQFAW